MTSHLLLAVAVTAASAFPFLPSLRQNEQQPGRPSFRTGIDVVSLSVTVTDASSRYVTSLSEQDFSVFEDGVKQDLILFNRSNLPIALSLLIDTSSSMEDRMASAQEAAVGFVRRIGPQDQAQIIGFDSRVEVLQGFTSKIPDLEQAIRRASPGGSTSLYNAVYIALKELKKVQTRQADDLRRQAIILLSDGEDTSSLVSFEEVLDLARRSETAIYAIGWLPNKGGTSSSASSKGFREATFALRQLATETGGRAFFPSDTSRELVSVYGQIYDELTSQYTIGYTSKNPKRDSVWRRLVVRIDRPNVTARTKQGYFAPSAP